MHWGPVHPGATKRCKTFQTRSRDEFSSHLPAMAMPVDQETVESASIHSPQKPGPGGHTQASRVCTPF